MTVAPRLSAVLNLPPYVVREDPPAIINEDKIATMAETQDTPFTCANCGTQYKVMRVEEASTANDRELTCLNCDAALQAREDRFILKYFLVGPKRPRYADPLDQIMIQRRRRRRGSS